MLTLAFSSVSSISYLPHIKDMVETLLLSKNMEN